MDPFLAISKKLLSLLSLSAVQSTNCKTVPNLQLYTAAAVKCSSLVDCQHRPLFCGSAFRVLVTMGSEAPGVMPSDSECATKGCVESLELAPDG